MGKLTDILEAAKRRNGPCPELQAMHASASALADLTREECVRVLRWVFHKWDRPDPGDIDLAPAFSAPPEGFP
jgi:hypothetical protein